MKYHDTYLGRSLGSVEWSVSNQVSETNIVTVISAKILNIDNEAVLSVALTFSKSIHWPKDQQTQVQLIIQTTHQVMLKTVPENLPAKL